MTKIQAHEWSPIRRYVLVLQDWSVLKCQLQTTVNVVRMGFPDPPSNLPLGIGVWLRRRQIKNVRFFFNEFPEKVPLFMETVLALTHSVSGRTGHAGNPIKSMGYGLQLHQRDKGYEPERKSVRTHLPSSRSPITHPENRLFFTSPKESPPVHASEICVKDVKSTEKVPLSMGSRKTQAPHAITPQRPSLGESPPVHGIT